MLEEALSTDINDNRFFAYIKLHEFETLILADPNKLDYEYLKHDAQIQKIIKMVGNKNPELKNDGPNTTPSKRILKEIPEYNKVNAGPLVVEKIGLPLLR